MTRAILIVWAGAATILAIHFSMREPPPPRVERRDRSRTVALERRVRELQAALATTLTPEDDGTAAEPDVVDLLARYRLREENPKEAQALLREMYRKVGSDAASHLAIMETLRQASSEDAAFAVVELLVANPFAKLVRNTEVTRKIREQARELVMTGTPFQRDAAARVLYGYDRPSRDDVLLGIERIGSETDAGVRDTLLEQLADHAQGVPLTTSEAAPFVDALRDDVAGGQTWAANAIAEWSSDESDFEAFRAGFREASNSSVRQDFLNAFRAGSRMGGQRSEACRAFLLDVLEDGRVGATERSLALSLLEGYAPWDSETADRIRRVDR